MSAITTPTHFQQLLAEDPQEICGRTHCRYDQKRGIYSLSAWGVEYFIDPSSQRITTGDKTSPLHEYFEIFLLHYLLNRVEIRPAGEWISEKDMAGGPTFFRGPHAIPTNQISETFGNDLESFKQSCKRLSGTPLDMADSAFQFTIVPHIQAALLYWIGDEDFPAEAKILYDKSLPDYFALDVVFALAITVCNRFAAGK